jgi:hypothetical protein
MAHGKRTAGSLPPRADTGHRPPFGLTSYALTYTGYQVFENLVEYRRG